MGLVWIECLEVVISGHTEPITGTACPLESSDFRDISNQRNYSDQVLSRLRSSSGVGNPISPSLTSLGLRNPCEVFLYLNCGHDMKPIGWWSYRVRVKSSLVLLAIFSHPVQLWCSLPSSVKSIEDTHRLVWETWNVLLFIQSYPFRLRVDENKFSSIRWRTCLK